MKRKYWVLLGSIFFLLLVKQASASTISEATIEASPRQGDITTDILVQVRGVPYRADFATASGDVPVLYLYYDDKVIVQRMKCVTYPKYLDYSTYEVSFDVTVAVPNEYPYSELGVHNITAVIEASDGTKANATTSFEIVNYVPPSDWWDDLPQDFVDSITGPQGVIGPQGETGSAGPQGEQGTQGVKGDPGPYPTEAVMLNLGVSVVSGIIAVVALILFSRVKKQ